MNKKKWDIFISHASEDKSAVARPLTTALRKAGARVWLDEHELTIGDSLSEKIDEGLSQSRFGAVILSPAFFAKHWPKKELTGLRAKEEEGLKVILPIWHDVDKTTVSQFSPILADVLAANTQQGVERVAEMLLDVIFAPTSDSPSKSNPSVARRFIELLESHPDKITLLDFFRYHLPRNSRWGGTYVFENYELYGVEFDAYSKYIGHGVRLDLVNFTETCADPFTIDAQGTFRICDDIANSISKFRLIQKRFDNDTQAQTSLVSSLASNNYYFREKDADYFKSWVPSLQFRLFAGRRLYIDKNTARHDTWSK